jgi:hypothetical protein
MKSIALSLIILGVIVSCKKKDIQPQISQLTVTATKPGSGIGGTLVTIRGGKFSKTNGDNSVKFNGSPAPVQHATDTSLLVAVPSGATSGKITVEVNGVIATGPYFYVTDIYAAGNDSNSAVYWKDSIETILQKTNDTAGAKAIFMNGQDIYVAGFDGYMAAYWKNGIETILPNKYAASVAYSIYVNGTDVYVAGIDNIYETGLDSNRNMAVYWKNGEEIFLSSMNNSILSNAYSITGAGNDIYEVGADNLRAVYWKNGVETVLDDSLSSGQAYAMALSGTDIYAAGLDYNGTNIYQGTPAAYWKNGMVTFLPMENFNSTAFAIAVNGSDVYVAGFNQLLPAYWTNGTETILPTNSGYGWGMAVAAIGNDVYVAGYDGIPLIDGRTAFGILAVYWEDGIEYAIKSSTRDALATSMIVTIR